jgi:toxin ParE1/3/4
MRRRSIIYLAPARQDLAEIADFLIRNASRRVARRFISQITARVSSLKYGSERGTILNPGRGLRIVGLLPSVSVAFVVEGDKVVIHQIRYGGRNIDVDAQNLPSD